MHASTVTKTQQRSLNKNIEHYIRRPYILTIWLFHLTSLRIKEKQQWSFYIYVSVPQKLSYKFNKECDFIPKYLEVSNITHQETSTGVESVAVGIIRY